MSTNFPGSADTFPSAATLAGHQLDTDPHSTLHGNLGAAIVALEAKVGANGGVTAGSIDALFSGLVAPLAGQVLVGNAGGTAYSPVSLSGAGAMFTLNSSGVLTISAVANSSLANSSLTVTTGAGLSGGGSVALGGTLTLVNVGVTSFNTRTGAVTLMSGDVTAALGDANIAFTDVANTFTVGPQTINIDADAHKGSVVKSHSATQSANLAEWQDSSGNWYATVNNSGTLRCGGNRSSQTANLQQWDGPTSGEAYHPFVSSDGRFHFDHSMFLNGLEIFVTGTPVGPLSSLTAERVGGGTVALITFETSVNTYYATQKSAATGPGGTEAIDDWYTVLTSVSPRFAANVNYGWATRTDATRKARVTHYAYDTAARETFREEASGSAAMLGFFGAAAVVQQADGAALTNNVTSGGTTDTIADITDGAVYANDYAAIRADLYQLARKVKIVDDALRAYGLLT